MILEGVTWGHINPNKNRKKSKKSKISKNSLPLAFSKISCICGITPKSFPVDQWVVWVEGGPTSHQAKLVCLHFPFIILCINTSV